MAVGQSPTDRFSGNPEEEDFLQELDNPKGPHWISIQLPWNTIHGRPWSRLEPLGQGSYGAVFVGMRDDGKLFAVKSITVDFRFLTPRSKPLFHMHLSEAKIMRSLRSKYIVRCLGCGRSKGANSHGGILKNRPTFDIFLEYAVRGSLRHVMSVRGSAFEEVPYIKQYTHDILRALHYMRKNRVVHGDLKLSNLVLAEDCVKLADWGGAKKLSRMNIAKILIGTRGYKGPEVQHRREQSYPADIFSLGCTVIEMATGYNPYSIVSFVTGAAGSVHQEYQKPIIPDHLSFEAKDFIRLCICKKPQDRWTAGELLHHPFITSRDTRNFLPYMQPIPGHVVRSLLEAPPLGVGEPIDDPITHRVYNHLTGISTGGIPPWFKQGLWNCVPMDLPASPVSQPNVAVAAIAQPLPPFQPNFVLAPNSKLSFVAGPSAPQPPTTAEIGDKSSFADVEVIIHSLATGGGLPIANAQPQSPLSEIHKIKLSSEMVPPISHFQEAPVIAPSVEVIALSSNIVGPRGESPKDHQDELKQLPVAHSQQTLREFAELQNLTPHLVLSSSRDLVADLWEALNQLPSGSSPLGLPEPIAVLSHPSRESHDAPKTAEPVPILLLSNLQLSSTVGSGSKHYVLERSSPIAEVSVQVLAPTKCTMSNVGAMSEIWMEDMLKHLVGMCELNDAIQDEAEKVARVTGRKSDLLRKIRPSETPSVPIIRPSGPPSGSIIKPSSPPSEPVINSRPPPQPIIKPNGPLAQSMTPLANRPPRRREGSFDSQHDNDHKRMRRDDS